MKAAVRCNALDMSGLAVQEKHGKREDRLSRKRRVRDADPLVHGGLELRELYDKHVDGARFNKAVKKPVLHFIVRFPPELFGGQKGPYTGSKEDRQALFMRQAVDFVNQTHGGSAAFAARVDRDELGETVVDVFACPVYEKRTKRTPPDKAGPLWASPSKFGKELAQKHEPELRRRHPKAKPAALTSPRMVGIALQSEFHAFFESVNGFKLTPKHEKCSRAPDRLEKEAYERIEAKENELRVETKRLAREESAALEARERALSKREADLKQHIEAAKKI